MPATRLEDAVAQAEQIRSDFCRLRHPAIGPAAQLSASFGVAAFGPGTSIRTAMRQADRALYAAKSSGRNRVEVAQEEQRAHPQPILSAA
ncbi:GGDEF domain-containing protein [Alteriqipengyuania lutimaris]|uniref:GGDEF domain-containing protein n=1 Tax=Alteriqipengyuania lutimaris TaxID=1538146 RepID=UPI002277D60F|nr:diguanylate cyclase [Alteriqipengyuania lutimaris]